MKAKFIRWYNILCL